MEIKEIQEDLEKFESLIKSFNFEYANFFAGNMKFPPVVREREINKIIRKYNLSQITNPTLRFKFNNLVARFLTYREKWNRKMMEKEGIKRTFVKRGSLDAEIQKNKIELNINKKIDKELEKLSDSYNKDKIKKVINKKVKEMQAKGFNDFDIKINIVNGKPKLLIRPKL
ncbi:hypothetical protein FHQ18_06395 [Deferribacter autotrophicus]|uniref:Uncharacterized protein n=1 Tax=Deferribacter autotrophicus TaxID=500465 RepID=A0A5A8F1P0_9BACT|nr:hypothetical protein [Deferribacter autotrophicus]KAA0258020.1 hypothetical protein FHQ18_06395 [Deferribacter autotrophicus]